jgi:hypothetical protein
MCLGAAPVSAQDGPVGFRFAFGSQHMGGDIGDALDRTIDAEFSILVPVRSMRVGGGANWGSFDVVGEEESWSQVRFHLLAGYAYPLTPLLRPYAEARWTYRRLRPEDDRFFGSEEEELLRDFVAQGGGVEGVLGVEIVLAPKLAIDLSGAFGSFGVSPDLSEEGLGPIDSGTTWRLHAGVTWFPMNER